MQPEIYAKIKVKSTPEGCAYVLRALSREYQVVTTSPVIKHREDPFAHQYATLYNKEVKQ